MLSTKRSRDLIALVDCNNFYASCERVFNPRLWHKPLVVLSNNDGCVVARSNEAKALGIPMGAPAFEYAPLFKCHQVVVLSSNYTLYGQMSHRVMQTLSQFSPEMEIYSIDEAFLHMENSPSLPSELRQIKEKVTQWTGIPVSIGAAPTKTLAKVANKYAKKKLPREGFMILSEEKLREEILTSFPVGDVWGIGPQKTAFLCRNGIKTAWELACAEDKWIEKNLTITGLRTAWELRGIACMPLEEFAPSKKSIVCSRSFGREVFKKAELEEALANYAASAAERLREQKSAASFLEVFLSTSRFKEGNYYANSIHVALPQPTDYTPHLIHFAKIGLSRIFKEGFAYKKIGVMMGGLACSDSLQQTLFLMSQLSDEKQRIIMRFMDHANAKYGGEALKYAAQGIKKEWSMRRNRCTARFTTSWDDLLTIQTNQPSPPL